MENLLNKIKELIAAYNDLPNAEKVVIVPEEYAKNMNIPLEEPTNDVSAYHVCVYDDGKVGLFKEIKFSSPKETVMNAERWNAGSLFIGVNSSLIAIKKTHEGFVFRDRWQEKGEVERVDNKRYVCNCNAHDAMTFDDMRLIMYENGEIGPYELGKATSRDLINVLKFAKKYYGEKTLVEGQQKVKNK